VNSFLTVLKTLSTRCCKGYPACKNTSAKYPSGRTR